MPVTDADLTLIIKVDWGSDGSFETSGDNISPYWITLDTDAGFPDPRDPKGRIAAVGTCAITLRNDDRRFSPGNASGPYYGKLLPGKAIRLQATDGVTTWPVWRGFIDQIIAEPAPGLRASLMCSDWLGKLQRHKVSMALQQNIATDELLKRAGATALNGGLATGYFTAATGPFDSGSTVTIGSVTYTFPAVGNADEPYEVQWQLANCGSNNEINLAAAINNDVGAGTKYGAGTVKHPDVTAIPISGIGYQAPGTGGTHLGDTNSQLAAHLVTMPNRDRLVQTLLLKMNKVGSPQNATIDVVLPDANGQASDTLVDPNATLALTAAMVPGVSGWFEVTFPGEFWLREGYILRLKVTGAEDAANYYQWANGTATIGIYKFRKRYSDGQWVGEGQNPHAFWFPGRVEITANVRGTWGNSIALAETGANVTKSGATLAGGTDAFPSTDYDAGRAVLSYAGDRWRGDINALSAIQEVVESEGWGWFWIAEDGVPTFRNNLWWFRRYNGAAAMTCSNEAKDLTPTIGLDGVFTEVTVSHLPRATQASGPIIRARSPIQVPGLWGTARWSGATLPVINPDGGSLITRIPATNADGNFVGILSLDLPPVAGTNYTVNENSDGSASYDYTYDEEIEIAVAVQGAGVECSFVNHALGALYVRDFYLTGVGLIAYDLQEVTYADQAAADLYGSVNLDIFLPLAGDHIFADELAQYLLLRHKTPRFAASQLVLHAQRVIGGVNPNSLRIGDVVTITENQSGLSSAKHVILGKHARYVKGGDSLITFELLDLESTIYGIYDDADNGYDECFYAL